MKKESFFVMAILLYCNGYAQKVRDSAVAKDLKELTLKTWQRNDINRLPDEQNGFLNDGKKNEVITLAATNANIALKTGRQVFAKVPGIFVYDMDGSGNQLNIATRGLDPHRSWEYNIRQNGVIINSDMYGYPASHYSAPMESYEKIEMIRGTASLQYGAQFGGMINYTTKKPDTLKALGFKTVNTAGSFGLLSSYNSISGAIKKFSYLAYYYKRHSHGYRKNSESDASAQFVQLNYQFNSRVSLKAEFGRSKYRYHIPGPLSDSMFNSNPQMSTRSRNYFSPDIYVPSLTFNWRISAQTKINITASAIFGNRSSVMLDAFANVKDSINPLTGTYKNRQVDIDNFNSRTIEFRFLHAYHIGKMQLRLAAGAVYMNNNLHRRQLGKGTTGADYDLTLTEPAFVRDIHFKTNNIALYAENVFQLSPRWTVSPGVRFEHGESKMSGIIKYYTVNELPTNIKHSFLLAGISSKYMLNKESSVYGGISQAYRPVIFKDIIPASTYEQIDKNLEDAFGYNIEVGTTGKLAGRLQYDISYFNMLYKNRLGTLILQDNQNQTYTYKTNIGNSRTDGVELFLQYKFPLTNKLYAGLFTSTSYMNARYISGEVTNGTKNESITGNKVEATPQWISRNGLDFLYRGFSCTFLYSHTSSSFSDALNTQAAPVSGAKGFTPGYSIFDFNASVKVNSLFAVRAGINNIFDRQYFTKRPAFYPGPGIWPSDGRNVYVTASIEL